MASTYVNNLRLNEMATGDASGTWGSTTNTNLELIGEALGYGTEAITTNADTHTTTVADGSSDAGRAMYLKYTGTLDSTCTITIGPNTMKRVQIIENATSGSQSIIISQGSGANVTIPTGRVAVVILDGAGSGAAVTNAFTDLDLAGTLNVAGNVTAAADLSVGDDLTLSSDSAVITIGADGDTTLTHTDGTGLTLNSTNKICFNDASQFIQGSSATVLSLGATDEIDLTATAIDVNGTIDISGDSTFGGVLSIPDGSAGSPSITNTGDTNAGLYFSAADTLAFTAGGTAQFTMSDGLIAPVTDSDVDLGTSSLEFKDLYLDGTAHVDTLDVDVNGTVAGTLGVTGIVTASTSANISQVAITSSSNAVAWDAAAAANAYHVTTENTTFSAPSNAVEGAIISVEIAQGGTARTIGWNTVFEFAASTAPTVTATASKTDIFSFRYNGSVWQEIGRSQNMAQT